MSDPIVERLAGYASSLEFEDLPGEVVHQVKRLVIDSIGCGLGASDAAPVRAARELALEVRGSSPATLLGTRETTTPEMAAFVNGAMVRYLDFNAPTPARTPPTRPTTSPSSSPPPRRTNDRAGS